MMFLTSLLMACLGLSGVQDTLSLQAAERSDPLPLQAAECPDDSLSHQTVHRLEAEVMDGAVLHTHKFLRGYNPEVRTMNQYFAARLKYAFMPPPASEQALVYKGSYQGAGVAYHHVNPQMGHPLSAFLFQGATIATLSPRVSFNYEWNFGVAYGWKSYDKQERPDNHVIGSKLTAYMDADFYLRWALSPAFDVNMGVAFSHFSNGNTSLPNGGLNVATAKLSLAYYVGRRSALQPARTGPLPAFGRHWSTDLLLYGGWKRRSMSAGDGIFTVSSPQGVVGVNVNPMYNLNHWLNVGGSLDVYYDHSANLSMVDSISATDLSSVDFYDLVTRPGIGRQIGVGLSARAEFVMPYFTINFGIGHNLLNAGTADFKGFYEVLALKIAMTRSVFLHIGYSIYDFYNPNNLMLGVGYRLGSRRR